MLFLWSIIHKINVHIPVNNKPQKCLDILNFYLWPFFGPLLPDYGNSSHISSVRPNDMEDEYPLENKGLSYIINQNQRHNQL